MGLFVTFVLGAFVLAGAAVAGFAGNGRRIGDISIAVALGAMAMLLLVDLVPEAIENAGFIGWPASLIAVASGVAVLALLDRFLPESHHHDHGGEDFDDSALHISIATTIALVIHNIVEGMSVYGISQQSLSTALVMMVGIGLHNIPMGMIVYSGLRSSSRAVKAAVLACAALSTCVGGLLMLAASSMFDSRLVSVMVCLTIGLLCYIVFFELLPHVRRSGFGLRSIPFICLGAAAVVASGFLELLA